MDTEFTKVTDTLARKKTYTEKIESVNKSDLETLKAKLEKEIIEIDKTLEGMKHG